MAKTLVPTKYVSGNINLKSLTCYQWEDIETHRLWRWLSCTQVFTHIFEQEIGCSTWLSAELVNGAGESIDLEVVFLLRRHGFDLATIIWLNIIANINIFENSQQVDFLWWIISISQRSTDTSLDSFPERERETRGHHSLHSNSIISIVTSFIFDISIESYPDINLKLVLFKC